MVRPEEGKCDVKAFFKTYATFHLVTARGDGSKTFCTCPGYHQDMVCEHAMLLDMLYYCSLQIPEKFVEECAAFRRRVGRLKGGAKGGRGSK